MTYPSSLREVNQYLHRHGMPRDMKVVKGRGYYYFFGGDASRWKSSGVYIYRFDELSFEGWLSEYESRVEEHERYASMDRDKVASELVKIARDITALWELDTYATQKDFVRRLVDVSKSDLRIRAHGEDIYVGNVKVRRDNVGFGMIGGWDVNISWKPFTPDSNNPDGKVVFAFFVDDPSGNRVVNGARLLVDTSKFTVPDIVEYAKEHLYSAVH